jgi:hypothetical protein
VAWLKLTSGRRIPAAIIFVVEGTLIDFVRHVLGRSDIVLAAAGR